MQDSTDAAAATSARSDEEAQRSNPHDGRADSQGGAAVEPDEDDERNQAKPDNVGDTAIVSRREAMQLWKETMQVLSTATKKGSAFPWSDYRERIMSMSHLLIDAGMASPKDITNMLMEIDNRCKTTGGGSVASGGDFLADWLSGKGDEVTQ